MFGSYLWHLLAASRVPLFLLSLFKKPLLGPLALTPAPRDTAGSGISSVVTTLRALAPSLPGGQVITSEAAAAKLRVEDGFHAAAPQILSDLSPVRRMSVHPLESVVERATLDVQPSGIVQETRDGQTRTQQVSPERGIE